MCLFSLLISYVNFRVQPFPWNSRNWKFVFLRIFCECSFLFLKIEEHCLYMCSILFIFSTSRNVWYVWKEPCVVWSWAAKSLCFSKTSSPPLFLPILQVWVIMELWSLRFMEETWSNSSTYRPSPRLGHYGNRSFLEMLICLKTLMCCSKYGFKVHKMAKAWSSLSNYVTMNVSEWELLSVSGSESAILRILFWSQWKISFWSH